MDCAWIRLCLDLVVAGAIDLHRLGQCDALPYKKIQHPAQPNLYTLIRNPSLSGTPDCAQVSGLE